MNSLERMREDIRLIREAKPVIHHITNQVVMNVTANLTLAIGAAPVMADEPGEVSDMVSGSRCLVLNMGTLTEASLEAMSRAGARANKLHIPVILDPVGVGATDFRMRSFKKILDTVDLDVIKGNYDEIRSISGSESEGKRMRGVDSSAKGGLGERIAMAKGASAEFNAVVAITGKEDVVASTGETGIIRNGIEMLQLVTGSGCMATSVIAVFLAIGETPFHSTVFGLSLFGLSSEIADKRGPGTLGYALIDSIHEIFWNFEGCEDKIEIEER